MKDPDHAAHVRAMFGAIAHRYDLLNHLLSFQLDRLWRRAALAWLRPRPGDLFLDACAGTADVALGLARRGARVVALDFSSEMLRLGRRKAASAGLAVAFVEADLLSLPFPPASFDGAAVAFGVRNLRDPAGGLQVLAAALRPGGRLAVLEFARPPGRAFRALYHVYFRRLLPRAGAAISGHPFAYRYLPESVMTFLSPAEMVEALGRSGLEGVQARPLALGAVTLVTARRPGR